MSRLGRATGATVVAVLVAAGLAAGSPNTAAAGERRRVIDVYRRQGRSAIARAIDRARPGWTIRIHRGRYAVPLEIDRPLRLKAVGPGTVTVDGKCETGITIDVLSDGVTLRGLRVIGAEASGPFTGFEVNFVGISGGVARRLDLEDTCGEAEYGINVYQTGHLTLVGNTATGFGDAGLYIGAINTGPVLVQGNETFGNNRGILVEESQVGTVTVLENHSHDNALVGHGPPAGILVRISDGILVQGNTATASGAYGIDIDKDSDGNRFIGNTALGNLMADIHDEDPGGGNCFSDNVYVTSDPSTLNPPC